MFHNIVIYICNNLIIFQERENILENILKITEKERLFLSKTQCRKFYNLYGQQDFLLTELEK